jgi:O-succinylbenzoic acid--CoA ligase
MLAEGYVGDPGATAAAFRTDPDGTRWFRTSDLGRLDDGRLTILGRADDVILTGGVNVAPAAVEDAIAEHLAELGTRGESCVVGVPDAEWGQAVVAVVAIEAAGRTPGCGPPSGGGWGRRAHRAACTSRRPCRPAVPERRTAGRCGTPSYGPSGSRPGNPCDHDFVPPPGQCTGPDLAS